SHGAKLIAICEQTPTIELARFASRLWRWPAKLAQAAGLRARLAGVAYRGDSWVRAAHGDERVREVELQTPRGVERFAVDQVAVGYGLIPNTELAVQLGCALDARTPHPCVRVDEDLATSVAGIYAAGEACGIGGVEVARIEGEMAGHAAAGGLDAARFLRTRRRRARDFAALLPRHFDLRPQLRETVTADTVICRCEDVRLGQLDGYADWRAAKLATRCGMGSCQGRICGAALAELRGIAPIIPPDTASTPIASAPNARAPVFPTRLASLAGTSCSAQRAASSAVAHSTSPIPGSTQGSVP
ncbi:MAG: FAD-dependent oxidoreductase, partial [Lysobacter sp.]